MINIDVKKGITEISGDLPSLCADFVRGLKELYQFVEKEHDKDFADKVLDEIFNTTKMSDEEVKQKVDKARKEFLSRLSQDMNMIESLKALLDKLDNCSHEGEKTDAFNSMFKDILDDTKDDE